MGSSSCRQRSLIGSRRHRIVATPLLGMRKTSPDKSLTRDELIMASRTRNTAHTHRNPTQSYKPSCDCDRPRTQPITHHHPATSSSTSNTTTTVTAIYLVALRVSTESMVGLMGNSALCSLHAWTRRASRSSLMSPAVPEQKHVRTLLIHGTTEKQIHRLNRQCTTTPSPTQHGAAVHAQLMPPGAWHTGQQQQPAPHWVPVSPGQHCELPASHIPLFAELQFAHR